MSHPQLWQQAQNLTHHSLQAFLLSILEQPHVYNLYQFLQHPQISTVQQKVLNLYKLFIISTYKTFPSQQLNQLSELKLKKLKKITILKLFEGLTEISLSKICQQISTSEDDVIDLLIEMSIASVVGIKIDEQQSKVEIHYAEVVGRQFTQQETMNLQSKIDHIINKNNNILNIIDDTYSQIKNKKDDYGKPQLKRFPSYK